MASFHPEVVLSVQDEEHDENMCPCQRVEEDELDGVARSNINVQIISLNQSPQGRELANSVAMFVRAFGTDHCRLLPIESVRAAAIQLLMQARQLRTRFRGNLDQTRRLVEHGYIYAPGLNVTPQGTYEATMTLLEHDFRVVAGGIQLETSVRIAQYNEARELGYEYRARVLRAAVMRSWVKVHTSWHYLSRDEPKLVFSICDPDVVIGTTTPFQDAAFFEKMEQELNNVQAPTCDLIEL